MKNHSSFLIPHTSKRKHLVFLALLSLVVLTPLAVYLARNPLGAKADSLLGFNEGTGSTVNDSNGNISGTITNATWQTESVCYAGNCLYFDGSGAYVSFGDDDDLDFIASDTFTLSFWFRHTPMTTGTQVIIAKYLSTSGTDGGYKVYMESDGDITFGIDDDQSSFPEDSVTSTAGTYDDNQWHRVAAVKNGTTGIYLYIDGLKVAEDTTITASNTLVNTDSFYLGIDGDGISNPYKGYLDELKVSKTAFTQTEVNADLLAAGPTRGAAAAFTDRDTGLSQGLVGYWNLDNGGTDLSGNSVGLLNTGSTSVGGKFGSANEYVPASTQFQYASSDRLDNIQTISFWANPDSTTNYLFSLNTASIQASSGTISTTGLSNPVIYVNGQPSTTLVADTWQHITVTTDSLHNGTTTSHHTNFPYQNSGPGPYSSIYCITENDCKMAYMNESDSSLRFMDCDDATCSSGTISVLDGGENCVLTGGDVCDPTLATTGGSGASVSLFCPTADDCKISYSNVTNTALMFADCADATCSSGSVEILDGYTGCGLTGGDVCDTSISTVLHSSLYCSSATDCKVSYYDSTNSALMFADCADATCSSGSVEILDGYTGCGLTGGDVCDETIAAGTTTSLSCPSATDCKVSYYDTTNTALMFADCADATCSSGSVEILDGYTGCGLTGGDVCDTSIDARTYPGSLTCVTADDCKLAYSDYTNTALMFADCADATCSTGSVETLDGYTGCGLTGGDVCATGDSVGTYASLACPSATDCKVTYYNSGESSLMFADCADATCSTGSVETLDGFTGCGLHGGDDCDPSGSTGTYTSLVCPSATSCKIRYWESDYQAAKFAACADTTCSSGSVEIVDGFDKEVDRLYDLYCLSPTDCKLAYAIGADSSLRFMDCDDASCTSGTMSILDGGVGCVLTGGDGCDPTSNAADNDLSLYCPTTDDCKVTYNNGSDSALMFADCDDATCSSGSVEILDGYTGCGLTGGDGCTTSLTTGHYSSLFCPSATDCKIAYYDSTNTAIRFADCDNATCSSGSVEILDGYTGCGLNGGDVCDESISARPASHSLYCPSATDCKLAYYDVTNTALMFADCADASCSSGSVEILDGYTGCGLTGGDICDETIDAGQYEPALYCPSATDCKVSYHDYTNDALMFADCADATCSSGSVEILDGYTGCGLSGGDGCDTSIQAGLDSAIDCPTADDCKIAYSDRGGNGNLKFADCADATCSSGSVDMLDGGASCSLTDGHGCNTSTDAGGFDLSLACTSATDCKLVYHYTAGAAASSLIFADCADATCSSGWVELVDSGLPTTIQVGKVGSNYFDGTLDEVRVYNQILSPAEVQDLYEWAPGPIHYYDLNENTSTTVYDKGELHVNSSGFTNMSWVPGKYGSGLDFNSSTSNVNIGDQTQDMDGRNWTFETWFNLHENGDYPRVFEYEGNDGSHITLMLDPLGWPTMGVDFITNGTELLVYQTPLPFNTWVHLATTYDGNYYKLYQNGVEVKSSTLGDDQATYFTRPSGSARLGWTASTVNGSIDDFRVYNYARTPAQIIEDMNAGHPAPGSPVGSANLHLKFDEGYGDTLHDSSPQGNNGNMAGANTCPGHAACPTWSTIGQQGKTLSFDGTGDYATVASATSLNLTTFSVSFWLRATNASDTGAVEQPFNKATSNSNGYSNYLFSWRHTTETFRKALAFYDGSNWQTAKINSTMNTDTWYHVVGTYDGANLKVYLDGQLESSTPVTTTPVTGNYSLFIGSSQSNNSPTNYFNGRIDDFQIFSSALTPDQINVLRNQGMATVFGAISTDSSGNAANSYNRSVCMPGDTATCNSPVGDWTFNEKSGSSAYDVSANGNTSSISGASWQHAGACKDGACLSFDGSDDYVNAGSGSTINPLSQITVEAWFYPRAFGGKAISRWDDSGSQYSYMLTPESAPSFYTDTNTNNVQAATSAISISLNQWHHIVGTYDHDVMRIYVNGVLAGTNNLSSNTDIKNYSGTPVYFGAGKNGAGRANFYNGLIDGVKIYNYARTASQVAWSYNRGAPHAHWKLDENVSGNSQTLYDSSGVGNNGTTDWGANAAGMDCTATGRYSLACEFDGVDDSINVGDPASGLFDMPAARDFSIGMWIKTDTSTDYPRLISKRLSTGDNKGYELYLNANANGAVAANLDSGTTNPGLAGVTSVTDDQWHHVLMKVSSTTATLYIDGKQDGVMTNTVIDDGYDNTVSMLIGDTTYSSGVPFTGSIDDVKVWRYALSDAQIRTEYTGGAVKFGP